jgi:hypothetical protein
MQQESNPLGNQGGAAGSGSYRATLEVRARRQKSAAAAMELREWHARHRREAHEALRAVFPQWVSSAPSERSTRRRDR